MKTYIYLLLASFLLVSCVTTSVTKLNPSDNYPPVSPDKVRVFLNPNDIDCDFTKIALIKTESGYAMKDEKSVQKAREKAGELGANGIILQGINEPSTGEKVANAIFWTGASKDGEMVAIRTPESCSDK